MVRGIPISLRQRLIKRLHKGDNMVTTRIILADGSVIEEQQIYEIFYRAISVIMDAIIQIIVRIYDAIISSL